MSWGFPVEAAVGETRCVTAEEIGYAGVTHGAFMSNARFFSTIVCTAVVTATLVGGLTLARPVLADTPRTMECMPQPSLMAVPKAVAAQQAWANEQLAAGKLNFVAMPLLANPTSMAVCAW
ncbi:MAG: hypothetical protein V4850_12105 [Myxococcota bacterium]